jgi:hypothetical protein
MRGLGACGCLSRSAGHYRDRSRPRRTRAHASRERNEPSRPHHGAKNSTSQYASSLSITSASNVCLQGGHASARQCHALCTRAGPGTVRWNHAMEARRGAWKRVAARNIIRSTEYLAVEHLDRAVLTIVHGARLPDAERREQRDRSDPLHHPRHRPDALCRTESVEFL